MEQLNFILNGNSIELEIDGSETLLEVIREKEGLTGTKQGCGKGDCGACSVMVDNAVVNSCIFPAIKARGKQVVTIEGIGTLDKPHPIQKAFVDVGAVQCGYCIPGMVISTKSLLDRNPSPSVEEIKMALSGNLCRCTGYTKIIEGVQRAAELLKGKTFLEEKARDALGARMGRLEGLEKAVGLTKYGIDLTQEGMLWVKALRSPYPHARIKGIDTSEAEALPGVAGVITAKDIRGKNLVGATPTYKDQPILVGDKARYVGDPIAAVAAVSEKVAEEAVKKIKVHYEVLEPVLDPFFGLEERSPKVHEDYKDGNLLYLRKIIKGDAERALKESDVVVENTFTTPFIEHAYLDTEAGIAYMDEEGRVVVHCSGQDAHNYQADLSVVMGFPADRIRVIQAATGGAFGGKIDFSVQGVLALFAYKLKKPVKWVYSREESFLASGKRHPYHIRCRAGANKKGKLTAVDYDVVSDTGAYCSWGRAIITRAAVHCTGPYYFPNVRYIGKLVYTNNPYGTAMRGFGVPQISMAIEAHMDMLAEKLGVDPLAFRIRNCLEPGKELGTGRGLTASVGIKACLKTLESFYKKEKRSIQRINEDRLKEKSHKRMGIGVGGMWFGIGWTGMPNPSEARAELDQSGQIVIYTGACDVGQGLVTTLTQISASEFGLPIKWVKVVSGDTAYTSVSNITCASRQTYISGNAVKMATGKLKRALVEAAAKTLEDKVENVKVGDGFLYSKQFPDHRVDLERLYYLCKNEEISTAYDALFDPGVVKLDENGQGFPYSTYAFGAQAAVVEVDGETGMVRVLKVAAAHDVGRAINPLSVEGQIQGGVLMGQGYALQEEFIPGLTKNFKTYAIPTISDMPEIIPIIIEDPEPTGPFGAKGVGEPALIPTAPAIVNAVYNATGARIYDLPLTPSRVLKALKSVK
jgi:CO/xanthine dehydrogenase Mo-binding subunit/aerobic-type carbon monoxide dehydrogenase small subunit (CoxS/CutS family)